MMNGLMVLCSVEVAISFSLRLVDSPEFDDTAAIHTIYDP